MELHLTSEQALLRDSAAKFVATAGPKVARKFRDADASFAPQRLREAGELGWLGILVPESAGGLGLGLTELALVLEQAGRGLVCEPIGLAAISAAALGQAPKPLPILEQVMAGEALVVPALQERAHGDDPLAPSTEAAGTGTALHLTGQKMFVCADGADGFLVSANGRDGLVLCFVARDALGCTLQPAETVDGRRLATLYLDGTPAELVMPHASAHSAVDALYNAALVALSAELLGVMEEAQRITLDYLRIRKQFGKLIGSFQALQHRMVDCYVDVELNRSLLFKVLSAWDDDTSHPAMVPAVKARLSKAALKTVRAALQLHGAIGYTEEHDIGVYYKRAVALAAKYGNEITHVGRFSHLTLPAQQAAG